MAATDPAHGTDLLFTFFADTWADAIDRQMCFTIDRCILEAIKDPRVDRLLVANPFRSGPVSALRRLHRRPPPPLPSPHKPAEVVQPLRLRRHDPTTESDLIDSYRSYDRRLQKAAAAMGLERPVIVSANPFAVAYCPFSWAGEVTYYGYDDWSAHPGLEIWSGAIETAYERIASRRRRVAAVSATIIERIDSNGPTAVIPNGIEPGEWRPPWQLPDFARDRVSPLILYVGSLGDRLDIAMIEATAARLATSEILLVGAVGNAGIVSQLARIDNVRIEAKIDRLQVAGLVHSADVCIMPHRSSELTVSMSPLKLYEYLAGGRPVVATDLPPVRGIDDRVIRVQPGDAEGFAAAVELALDAPPVPERQRQEFIDANSWSSRFDQLLEFATGSETVPSPTSSDI